MAALARRDAGAALPFLVRDAVAAGVEEGVGVAHCCFLVFLVLEGVCRG